jgi:hypothetical protein
MEVIWIYKGDLFFFITETPRYVVNFFWSNFVPKNLVIVRRNSYLLGLWHILRDGLRAYTPPPHLASN